MDSNFPQPFYQFLRDHTLIEIKGGTTRERFLPIWMVEIDGRVFARSWSKSARSWFTAFLDEGVGQIKYGDEVIDVVGEQVIGPPALQQMINQAYLEKFTQPDNVPYAQGFSDPAYEAYTMEFRPR